jgi:TPR repeat protein
MCSAVGCNSKAYYTALKFHPAQYAALLTPYLIRLTALMGGAKSAIWQQESNRDLSSQSLVTKLKIFYKMSIGFYKMSKLNLRAFLAFGLIGTLFCVVFLNAYSYGRYAMSNGNHKTARLWFRLAATTGNASAQNNLAGLYAEGRGGERNNKLAAEWFQRAADQGVVQAMFNLSNFYEDGTGVDRNTTKAVALLEGAASHGDLDAAFNLGSIYATGRDDFQKNVVQGIIWYQKAAERGHASAQYNLGSIYAQGVDVPKDLVLAGKWYTKAAQKNHAKALLDLGTMYAFGVGYEQDISKGLQLLDRAAAQPSTTTQAKDRMNLICTTTKFSILQGTSPPIGCRGA